jgi:hypothetical protein
MPKIISREDFIRSAGRQKRRYSALTLSDTGLVSLQGATQVPCFWFERHEEVIDGGGRFTIDSKRATVTLMVDGVASVLFYLSGRRIEACTFAFALAPSQLRTAAAAMRRAGLSRLIGKAASGALENLPEERRATIEEPLRLLARKHSSRRPSHG